MKRSNESGFLLVMTIIILLVLSISIPALINWVRQETKDTVKVKRTSHAFHLAEAGVDQGIWKLQESMAIWTAAKTGTAVADYDGGTQFSLQLEGGSMGNYTVAFSSGPETGQVTILAKGQDVSTREIRAIQAVVEENGAGNSAISAKRRSDFSGGATQVEWGPVIGISSILSTRNHPRYYSGGSISLDTNGSAPANTDGVQWWSYKQDLPPAPLLDFTYYKNLSLSQGNSADADCGAYRKYASFTFNRCTDTTGKTFYVEGDCTFTSPGNSNHIIGNVLCTGNISWTGGGGANGTENMQVPPLAWKEYGNAWNFYKTTYDPLCPHATYADAVAANYAPTIAVPFTISNVLVHGLLYTGGGSGLNGGGNANLIGVLISAIDTVMTTSNATLYYDPTVAASVKTTNVIISRESWKELTGQSFP